MKKYLPLRYSIRRRFNWWLIGLLSILEGIVVVLSLTLIRPGWTADQHDRNFRYDMRIRGKWRVK